MNGQSEKPRPLGRGAVTDYRALISELEASRTSLGIRAAQAMRSLMREEDQQATFGRLTVYLDDRNPEVDGKPVKLTKKELQVLQALARKRRHLTQEELFSAVWGLDSERETGIVRVYVLRLRRALSAVLGFDPFEFVRGRGYAVRLPA
jgi:DNA-binding response OmpR family regulator